MNWWVNLVTKRPVWILGIAAGVVALAGAWGLGVFGHLSDGGFEDPNSSSAQAAEVIAREFPSKDTDLVVLFTARSGKIADPAITAAIKDDLAKLAATPGVQQVTSTFSTPAPSFNSKDGRQTYALLTLDGGDTKQRDTFRQLESSVSGSSQVRVQYGGEVAVNEQINQQTEKDLAKAELLSVPVLGILLLIIFRSVVAALVPLALGGLSILVAFLLVRVLSLSTDVSIYAINIITLMGLGLSIDYSLFTVSRFREELARGRDVSQALDTTLRTAGRTVLFSGLTVILSLLGLLVFEQNFLRSMGLGGAAAVAATVLLSATILPAVLKLLGRRINAWALPGLSRSLHQPPKTGILYRYSHFVMRHPLVTLGVALELLVILGLPFLSARFSTPDVSVVPEAFSSRQVDNALRQNFVGASQSPITIVARTDASAAGPEPYLQRLRAVSGVTEVAVAGQSGTHTEVKVTQAYQPQSANAQQVVRDVRAAETPAGWQEVRIGGQTAELVDLLDSLRSKLPWAALIIVVATSVLLFLMLGSVVIPVKAVILNVLSLSAAFGLLVWIFQDGHWVGALGLTSNGTIDATQPILIFAIAFGLAMDYELFLLSRVKEEYDRTGDNVHSVAYGIQHTAGIITSAALILVVVIGLFATGKISLIQQVGVGLAAAVAIDATLVRMVLVPTAMRLLGEYNWWAPRPLAKLARRLGLRESA